MPFHGLLVNGTQEDTSRALPAQKEIGHDVEVVAERQVLIDRLHSCSSGVARRSKVLELPVEPDLAGVVRRADGFVHLAPNLGWHDVPLGSILRQRLALPVPLTIANDADLGGLAEHARGAGRGTNDMV